MLPPRPRRRSGAATPRSTTRPVPPAPAPALASAPAFCSLQLAALASGERSGRWHPRATRRIRRTSASRRQAAPQVRSLSAQSWQRFSKAATGVAVAMTLARRLRQLRAPSRMRGEENTVPGESISSSRYSPFIASRFHSQCITMKYGSCFRTLHLFSYVNKRDMSPTSST